MGWYDHFARIYDASLESLYAEGRSRAVDALELGLGDVVLDLPTGTGQSIDGLCTAGATVVGVDFSAGMLRRAQARVASRELRATLIEADARTLSGDDLADHGAPRQVDALHVFLGLTAIPDWERAFANLWTLLRPGGRCVCVDVYAARPGLQGHMVQLVAQADITRRWWTPLEAVSEEFRLVDLPHNWQHGGQLRLASGRRPA